MEVEPYKAICVSWPQGETWVLDVLDLVAETQRVARARIVRRAVLEYLKRRGFIEGERRPEVI